MVYLVKLFGITAPSDPEIIKAWHKPLEKTNLIIAKEMAQMYFREEKGRFNFARLMEYKTRAMAGRTYHEPKDHKECEYCRNTGWVQMEERIGPRIYEIWRRCCCRYGDELPKNIKQISPFEVEGMFLDRGVYRLEEPPYVEVPENIMKLIVDCINKFSMKV